MSYFKGVAIGLGTAVLGCIVTPVVIMLWWLWRSYRAGEQTVSFSPMGFINHFGLARPWFWLFIIALFFAGFLISMKLQKR